MWASNFYWLGDGDSPNYTKGPSESLPAIAKAAGKCQAAKLSTFNSCKKDKLKAVPAGAADIESCLGTGTSGIPDGKGKIGKKCGNGLGGTIGKKCGGQDLDALFPGLAPGVDAAAIDAAIKCEVCKALNLLNDLSRDCDEFDDGTVNSSCL